MFGKSYIASISVLVTATLMVGVSGVVPDTYGAPPTPKACETYKGQLQVLVELGIFSEAQMKLVLQEVNCAQVI